VECKVPIYSKTGPCTVWVFGAVLVKIKVYALEGVVDVEKGNSLNHVYGEHSAFNMK
jgi:hypothetical protein